MNQRPRRSLDWRRSAAAGIVTFGLTGTAALLADLAVHAPEADPVPSAFEEGRATERAPHRV